MSVLELQPSASPLPPPSMYASRHKWIFPLYTRNGTQVGFFSIFRLLTFATHLLFVLYFSLYIAWKSVMRWFIDPDEHREDTKPKLCCLYSCTTLCALPLILVLFALGIFITLLMFYLPFVVSSFVAFVAEIADVTCRGRRLARA